MEQTKHNSAAKVLLVAVLSLILSLSMAFAILPATTLTAYAMATELAVDTVTWENGDYVVPAGGVTISGHITVNGTVNLTLTEGATLTANTGITLGDNSKLNVSGEGTMVVKGSNGNTNSTVAGTGKLVLKSGTLTAIGGNGQSFSSGVETTGSSGGVAINGAVTVSGGTLAATGGDGGSINGHTMSEVKGGAGGVAISGAVTINNGTLTAIGGNGGSVTISNWGNDDNGGNGGAAIGGALTVSGGTMTAKTGSNGTASGKGGPYYGGTGAAAYSGTLTLGANVKLYEGTDDTGTVLDDNDGASREYTGGKKASMYAYGPDFIEETDKSALNNAITAAERMYVGIKDYTEQADIASALKTAIDTAKEVADNNEADQDAVDTATTNLTAAITIAEASLPTITETTWENETYFVPMYGATIVGHITVNGTVNIILTKGAMLTANAGITISDGATLNVSGDGTMVVNGSNGNTNSTAEGTGILILKSGTLTVIGGTGGSVGSYQSNVTASDGGAAINGAVIVNGGALTATGGTGGNCGNYGAGNTRGGTGGVAINGSVTVNGGTLTAANGASGIVDQPNYDAHAGAGGAGYSGTLTLGKNVKLYEGTEANDEKLLDGNDSASRVYEGEKKAKMFAQGTDKSALNDAIINAKILYYGIKDNTDYSDIATTLKTAIDTANGIADNIEADQDAVDTATTTLGNALKEAKDTKAVIDEIKDLPESTALTTENYTTYKDAINQADTDYNALSEDAQGNVPDALQSKLEACKAVIDSLDFAAYKEAQKTEADNKAQAGDSDAATALITAAKKAIDDLTYDTSKPLEQNKAAVTAVVTQLTTDLADQRAADPVIAQINALDEGDDITTADKDAIQAARKAFDELTEDQQKKVSTETLKKLTDAEAALAVVETINALPEVNAVTTADKAAIEAARAACNALTDDQKGKVSADTLKKLTDAEAALKEAEDNAAANAVKEKIAAIGEVAYTTESKGKIDEAREAYDALTADQKALVDNYATLTTAETTYATEKKTADDNAAANAVKEKITAIGTVEYTTESKGKIDEAKEAYEALTADQKALVDNYATLTIAETTYATEKKTAEDNDAANTVKEKIAAIGTVEYTTESKGKIDEAREAYDALTADQKALVTNYGTLTSAEGSYTDLTAVKEAEDAVSVLPASDDITVTDKAAVAAAKAKYDALTPAQKATVSAETVAKLSAASNMVAAQEVVVSIGNIDADNPDSAKVTEARAAYDALTDEQKAKVTNYESLTAAESKLIEINNPEKKGLSGGAIAGIVIAFVVVLGALGALLFSYFKQKKAEKK